MSPESSLYVAADGDLECYVPASVPLNEARTIAAGHAADTIGGWGRSRYTGKRDVPLHDHDEWECCEACPSVAAWCFEVYEGTYRR
jgi:hypothetical protein